MANPQIISDGLHTAGAVVSAEEARLSLSAEWARSSTGVGTRTGVVYAGVSTLVSATATTAPSMTVTVPPLHAVCQKAAAEGVYVVSNPATQTVLIAAAPGSNSRIDVVYIMQMDAASTTSPDASTQAVVSVVTGTAAASPTKPAIPAGAVELGTVTVAAGATKTTDGTVTVATTARFTAPLGTPVPCRNASERTALTAYAGLNAFQLDTQQEFYYTGSAWVITSRAPTYFTGSSTTNLPTDVDYGVGAITMSAAASGFATGGTDTITWNQAGLVAMHCLFYIPEGTRTKRGMIKRSGSVDSVSPDFLNNDRASLSFVAKVVAGEVYTFNQRIIGSAGGGVNGTTFSTQILFTPDFN